MTETSAIYRIKKGLLSGDLWIWMVISLSLLARIRLYSDHAPLWDSSVYISMGKYIYSSGSTGLWESLRPVLWPLMLGLFWKLGCDPVFWGKILVLFFSLGSIYIVYWLGKSIFDKRTGIVAAVFLSFSPTYFVSGNYLLTRIPSTFFGLLSLCLLLNNRFFLSAAFSAAAFLTNFTQFLLFASLFLANFLRCSKKDCLLKTAKFVFGFTVIIAAFLIFNRIMYKRPFYPLAMTYKALGAYSFYWHKETFYYIKHLITKENFCLPFYLTGLFLIIKRDRRFEGLLILLVGLVFFIFANIIHTQQSRYLIPSLPYLYMVSAYGITQTYDWLKRKTASARILLYGLIVASALFGYGQLKDIRFPPKRLDVFQEYIRQNEDRIRGSIWISDPRMLLHSNLKASELMYYPVFDAAKARELQGQLNTADFILFNSSDMPCTPQGDIQCEIEKTRLIENIRSQFHAEAYGLSPSGELKAGIFKRRSQD